MRGYDDATYGEGFADIYDEWYHDISDVAATVATLAALANGGRVLELGVGTGRLAVPLAAKGLEVHGIDSSPAMLRQLAAKAGGEAVFATLGDMSGDGPAGLPDGPFALVFIAYNTLFGLPNEQRQRDCLGEVAKRLTPEGLFAIEAFVPDPMHDPAPPVTVRSMTVDRVVLSVSASDPSEQIAHGQYIDITATGGIRLRPWSIRWATVEQLDEMAAAAGLVVSERWESFDRAPFGPDSARHVSVYRLRSQRCPPASAP